MNVVEKNECLDDFFHEGVSRVALWNLVATRIAVSMHVCVYAYVLYWNLNSNATEDRVATFDFYIPQLRWPIFELISVFREGYRWHLNSVGVFRMTGHFATDGTVNSHSWKSWTSINRTLKWRLQLRKVHVTAIILIPLSLTEKIDKFNKSFHFIFVFPNFRLIFYRTFLSGPSTGMLPMPVYVVLCCSFSFSFSLPLLLSIRNKQLLKWNKNSL